MTERKRFRGCDSEGFRIVVDELAGIPRVSDLVSLIFDPDSTGEWIFEEFYVDRSRYNKEINYQSLGLVRDRNLVIARSFESAINYASFIALDWGCLTYKDCNGESKIRLDCIDGVRWEISGDSPFILGVTCRLMMKCLGLEGGSLKYIDVISPSLDRWR